MSKQIVGVGSVVDIQLDDQKMTFTISNGEGNGTDTISANSPLAQALIGHGVGDTVEVNVKDNKFNVNILKIKNSKKEEKGMSKKVKKGVKTQEQKEVREIKMYEMLAALPQAQANLAQDCKVRVGQGFVTRNGVMGYAVTLQDVKEGSPTQGFQLVGFARETADGRLFMGEFSQLKIVFPEVWNAAFNKPAREVGLDLIKNPVENGQPRIGRLAAGGFLFTAVMAKSGKGARVFARVVDPNSPFFGMGINGFVGENDRGTYVMPSPNFDSGVTTFELVRRNQQVAPLVPVRDEEGNIVRDEGGKVVTEHGNPRWVTVINGVTDALAYIAEQGLIFYALQKAQAQLQARAQETTK